MLLLAALAAASPTASRPPRSDVGGVACPKTGPSLAADQGQAHLKRLDRLPPTAQILTVLRSEGGCETPVIVRYGIGNNVDAGAPVDIPSPASR
ncbi:MAG: hypothetical protein DI605_16270 [Sphingomonas sp.]|nr:MAG: hypothetical protein DI605_16270 [Sphingomonas sp.]